MIITTVDNGGRAGYLQTNLNYMAVTPTLYLNSSIKIISGEGTSDNPYILSL